MRDRDYVGIGVDIFVERLGITGVGTESHAAVIEAQIRYTRRSNRDVSGYVQRISPSELVQHRGTERVDIADLTIGELLKDWIEESRAPSVALTYRIGKAEAVGQTVPVYVSK